MFISVFLFDISCTSVLSMWILIPIFVPSLSMPSTTACRWYMQLLPSWCLRTLHCRCFLFALILCLHNLVDVLLFVRLCNPFDLSAYTIVVFSLLLVVFPCHLELTSHNVELSGVSWKPFFLYTVFLATEGLYSRCLQHVFDFRPLLFYAYTSCSVFFTLISGLDGSAFCVKGFSPSS